MNLIVVYYNLFLFSETGYPGEIIGCIINILPGKYIDSPLQ